MRSSPVVVLSLALLPGALFGCGPQKAKVAVVDALSTAEPHAAPPAPLTPDAALAALRALRAKVEASPDVRPRLSEYEEPVRVLSRAATATGADVSARVVVLEGTGYARPAGPTRAVISVRDRVANQRGVLELDVGGDPLQVGARRLFSDSDGRLVSAGPSSFLLNRGGDGFSLYTSVDAKPLEIKADHVTPSNGRLAFHDGEEVFVIDAATGREILPRMQMDGGGYPEWKNGDKWLSNCAQMAGGGVTLVVDVESKKVLFQSDSHVDATPSGCALDVELREVAIVYETKNSNKAWLETWSLDTGKRLAKTALRALPTDLEVEIDGEKNAVNIRSWPYRASNVIKARYDAKTGAELALPPASAKKAPPKGDPLAALPIGDASPFSDVSAFSKLATPHHEIDPTHFDSGMGMTATGVLSQDKATLALFETADPQNPSETVDPDSTDMALLLVDTKTMKVAQRIAPPHILSYAWAAVRFLDPKTAVFHFDRQHWLVDVPTGAILAKTDFEGGDEEYEMPTLLTPAVVEIGDLLLEVRRNGSAPEARRLVTPYWSWQGSAMDPKALKNGDLDKIEVDRGKVTTPDGSTPPYVLCIIGGEAFPYEVCSAWH